MKIDRVNLEIIKGKIRLRWTYQGKRYSLSIGDNNEQILDLAKSKAYQINSEIYLNTFDYSKYKPSNTVTETKGMA